ncbi:hypothetical protein ER308_11800 [Egibacter rhizosphaerae]|uniref:Uncharacterized protein n=1 Tax=Egibacter rhizosphaerae TaxID=1670831 RepID=A0A411YG71_9ACTN|nr:hypothetical protein [Egibacter rhizosphaerae]QBI20179.1 hypothetical protein ER308_11800 [Egibacter rhizosphaerae]
MSERRTRPARRLTERLARRSGKDPYEGLPVDDELGEPILPRWFVLTALAFVPLVLVVGGIAFLGFGTGLLGGEDVPAAERRPPPEGPYTTGVGELVAGEADPERIDAPCSAAEGLRVAGTEQDRATLYGAVDAACDSLGEVDELADGLEPLADHGAILRFATFEATGVDVTTDLVSDPPVVYANARYAQQAAELIVPLLAHEADLLRAADRGDELDGARTALDARARQARACEAALDRPSRACEDTAELLALEREEAVERLRAAGFR